MDHRVLKSTTPSAPFRTASWLTLAEARRVAPVDAAELPLTIRFEGLTEDEQRRALASFPGGRRFILAQ